MKLFSTISLLALLLLAGCGDKTEENKTNAGGGNGGGQKEVHGPNGGPLYELAAADGGEHYHVEWFHDKQNKKLVIVVLNEDSGEVAVKADEALLDVDIEGLDPTTYAFQPVGEGDEHSRFELAHSLPAAGAIGGKTGHTHIHIVIDGKDYFAEVVPHTHSH